MMWLLSILIWVLEGALIGWIASKIMGGAMSFGMYFVIGIVGSLIGGFLSWLFGINTGFWLGLIMSIVGSCILLWIVGRVRRSR